MNDPLSEVVRLLRPRAVVANLISGKGSWAVRYTEYGLPSFCIVLEGSSLLAVDGHAPITIQAGDFVLLPTTPGFTLSSHEPASPVHLDPRQTAAARGELRYGERRGRPDMRSLGGAFAFDGADASLLVSLLPRVVHVQGSTRLARLVQMVGEESAAPQPGGEFMRSRLVEMMLVEAMRSSAATGGAPPGLLRGAGRRATGARTQATARPCGPRLERGPAGQDRGPVPFRVLRALHARGGPGADGLPARLAHGDRQGAVAPRSPFGGVRRGRARGLWLHQQLQCGLQQACGDAADSVCADGAGKRCPVSAVLA